MLGAFLSFYEFLLIEKKGERANEQAGKRERDSRMKESVENVALFAILDFRGGSDKTGIRPRLLSSCHFCEFQNQRTRHVISLRGEKEKMGEWETGSEREREREIKTVESTKILLIS